MFRYLSLVIRLSTNLSRCLSIRILISCRPIASHAVCNDFRSLMPKVLHKALLIQLFNICTLLPDKETASDAYNRIGKQYAFINSTIIIFEFYVSWDGHNGVSTSHCAVPVWLHELAVLHFLFKHLRDPLCTDFCHSEMFVQDQLDWAIADVCSSLMQFVGQLFITNIFCSLTVGGHFEDFQNDLRGRKSSSWQLSSHRKY